MRFAALQCGLHMLRNVVEQIAIMAHVSINFVMKFSYAGEPVLVTVVKP